MKTLLIDDHNQGIFSRKLGHFFQIFEKGQSCRFLKWIHSRVFFKVFAKSLSNLAEAATRGVL